MASRVQSRQSGITPSFPPYEVPRYPLNPAAQRALAQLARGNDIQRLEAGVEQAQKYLTEAAIDLNDRSTTRETALAKLRERRIANGETPDEDANESTEAAHGATLKMTDRLDEAMRKAIDAQHSLQALKRSLASTVDNDGRATDTQTYTQDRRTRQRHGAGTLASENGTEAASDSPDESQDFTPTDPVSNTQSVQPPSQAFLSRIESDRLRYQNFSLTERYANNNAYRDFRRAVHDARHPDGDVALPHQSAWFPDEGPPLPGVTAKQGRNMVEDEDDDIAVSRAVISTKCPITLLEFKKPLTSRKCPHSFEADAILGMIRTNRGRPMHCPVSGCQEMLAAKDLYLDTVLVRKIERLQRARRMDEEDDDSDGGAHDGVPGMARNAHVIDDFDEDETNVHEPSVTKAEH